MHRAAVWQHSSNSNIKIVHNSIEHFFWNPSDFSFDEVLSCPWIVFTNSVVEAHPQKIVRGVEILGKGWPRVLGLMQSESVPWGVMPEVFKCSVREMRWVWRNEAPPQTREDIIRKGIRWISQEMLNRVMDNFNVGVAAVLSYSSGVYGTNIILINEKVL